MAISLRRRDAADASRLMRADMLMRDTAAFSFFAHVYFIFFGIHNDFRH